MTGRDMLGGTLTPVPVVLGEHRNGLSCLKLPPPSDLQPLPCILYNHLLHRTFCLYLTAFITTSSIILAASPVHPLKPPSSIILVASTVCPLKSQVWYLFPLPCVLIGERHHHKPPHVPDNEILHHDLLFLFHPFILSTPSPVVLYSYYFLLFSLLPLKHSSPIAWVTSTGPTRGVRRAAMLRLLFWEWWKEAPNSCWPQSQGIQAVRMSLFSPSQTKQLHPNGQNSQPPAPVPSLSRTWPFSVFTTIYHVFTLFLHFLTIPVFSPWILMSTSFGLKLALKDL